MIDSLAQSLGIVGASRNFQKLYTHKIIPIIIDQGNETVSLNLTKRHALPPYG